MTSQITTAASRAVRLMSPAALRALLPVSPALATQIQQQRQTLQRQLQGEDERLLVVVGPCSVHDPEAALDYARRLLALQTQVSDRLLLVMRVYIEKPRTCLGWKGLVNEPQRDGRTDINAGLQVSRQLMLDIAALGLPIATEALNPNLAGYFADLVSWYALGARTTESQTHREMASALPGVIGFKNATDGSIDVAIHAMQAAAQSQSITGVDDEGCLVQLQVTGNAHSHLVLRGGSDGPNYDAASIRLASQQLTAAGLNPRVMVDASHANCGKVAVRQMDVLAEVGRQLQDGQPIMGVMLESFLHTGSQPLQAESGLYGVSMTDPCLGWAETETALCKLADAVRMSTCFACA